MAAHTDPNPRVEGRLVQIASLTAVLAMALLTLSLLTGNSHIAFQVVRGTEEYVKLLLERGWLLRLELCLDYVFLCFYCSLLVLIRDALREWLNTVNAPIWLALLLLSALFDAAENANVLAMLATAEQELQLPALEMTSQALLGHLKFISNYAGLLLLSFALPVGNFPERALVCFLRWIQAPLGTIVLAMPASMTRPFALIRVFGLIAAFWTLAWVAYSRGQLRS